MLPTPANVSQVQSVVSLLKGLQPAAAEQVLKQLQASFQVFIAEKQEMTATKSPVAPGMSGCSEGALMLQLLRGSTYGPTCLK